MPQECAFCPATACFTGEHLWSNWINKVLTDRSYQFRRLDKKTQKISSWESGELNMKARVVCGDCNSGWMSKVDNQEAKPILRHLIADPAKRILQLRSIISLAVFGFKTAVVADHIGAQREPFFTREQRHAFARNLQLPGGLFMWLAAVETQTRGAFKTRYVVPEIVTEDDFRFYVFTYCVGHFALQVVGTKWTTDDPNRAYPFPVIEQNPSDSIVSTSFWPIQTQSAFSWPPSAYLPEDSIDAFAGRWGTLNLIK
jgi:hypothetical protein